MLEATFSPLIPTDISENFYINFYNQFSFIQINDIFLTYMMENVTDEDNFKLLDILNAYNDDQNIMAVYSISSGIMNESLMRRTQEKRGISTELFNRLGLKKIDPLDWYKKSLEFLMIYAICEQAIKEFLVSKGKQRCMIKENNILNTLFETLRDNCLRDNFIKELKDGSSSIIKSQNELISAWKYYTLFRHSLAHSGGMATDTIKENFAEMIIKNKKELESICNSIYIELSEDKDFFVSPFNNEVILITDSHLNFFRNMAILIIESLERAIHPNEYEIKNFDPYKIFKNIN